jgi:hypothetical protein
MLHNASVLTVSLILHRVRWKDIQEWRIGKNFNGGGNGLFTNTSACLTLRNTYEKFSYIFPSVCAS